MLRPVLVLLVVTALRPLLCLDRSGVVEPLCSRAVCLPLHYNKMDRPE